METNEFSFNKFQKEIDKQFTEIIHNLPKGLIKYVRDEVLKANGFFKNNSFQLELIADTNILFSEVRSLMINNSSFLLKIADNPFIKIYAPTQLKDELYEKIKIKFPKDNKTKEFNIKDCLKKADILLSKITINNKITDESLSKAKTYMQERDADDVAFVALNFSLKTHGVLTNDRDIIDQNEIKTWKLGEVGQVITEMSKGSFSFLILNSSLPLIWETIYGIIISIWAAFIEIVEGLISVFTSILTKSITAIANMPPELAIAIGIGIISLLLFEESRKKIGVFFNILWEQIKEIIRAIRDIFKTIWETLKEIFEALKPFFNISFQLLEYFISQSCNTMLRLKQLEATRPE